MDDELLFVIDFKQLLDEVFLISGIIKVEVSVISRSRRRISQKPNLIIVLFYIVLSKITTNALSRFHIKRFQSLG